MEVFCRCTGLTTLATFTESAFPQLRPCAARWVDFKNKRKIKKGTVFISLYILVYIGKTGLLSTILNNMKKTMNVYA